LDRVDKRNGIHVILDYKTGYVQGPDKSFLDLGLPDEYDVTDRTQDQFAVLAGKLPDIQLPYYVYLYGNAMHISDYGKINAGFVRLDEGGREVFLVDHEKTDKIRYHKFFQDIFPRILGYIIDHMVYGPILPATNRRFCKSCEYRLICRQS